MSDEADPGVDKRKILDEIGASAPLPGSAPFPPRPTPAPPRDLPLGGLAAMAPPTLAEEAPQPEIPRRPKSRWERHRRQISALVLVFVALLWFGVGLATEERMPFGLGGTFLGLAVLVWIGSLVRDH